MIETNRAGSGNTCDEDTGEVVLSSWLKTVVSISTRLSAASQLSSFSSRAGAAQVAMVIMKERVLRSVAQTIVVTPGLELLIS